MRFGLTDGLWGSFHYWSWRIFFEPRDCWVGFYWKRHPCALDVYICLVPMMPLNIYLQWNPKPCTPQRPEEHP